MELFDQCRNLIPIFSIEGHQEKTDERRRALSFLPPIWISM